MKQYQFADVSHHKGVLNYQSFADAGHRFAIVKASDGYVLAEKDGTYLWDKPWSELRHTDCRFVDNFTGFRKVGLVVGAYSFIRFDRPLGVSEAQIVASNLKYLLEAIATLPTEHQSEAKKCGIIDMEQNASQLLAAGLSKEDVSRMAWDIVAQFVSEFDNVIFYSGSWWTDRWITDEVMEKIAEVTTVWEPEYKTLNPLTKKPYSWASFTVPHGFSTEFATSADNMIGKTFGWQYTPKGVVGTKTNLDLNFTELPKHELYKIFGQDGAVEPPGGVEPPVDVPESVELESGQEVTVRAK